MSRWQPALDILFRGIEDRAFPGAAFAVWHEGITVASKAVGRFTYSPDSTPTQADTVFDLASVTKVLATTALCMRLWQRNSFPLDLPVTDLLPEFVGGDDRKPLVTLKMLLAHTSGLPAHRKLYELPAVLSAQSAEARAHAAIAACLAMPLEADPGERVDYSDIGFIVLGEAIRRLTSARDLQTICAEELFRPLGMPATRYLPPADLRPQIAPTRDWNWRHRVLHGEVQDENCEVLGGIAAHAGIFSTCADLLRLGATICTPGDFLEQRTIDLFSARVSGARALGWDTPSDPSQSGRMFSEHSIGHLGYTGTSLWIDLQRRIVVTLLTNRVYTEAGPANQGIQQVRPTFHDAVMTALGVSN